MIQSIQNNLLLKVEPLYISNISSILKIAAIENNSSVDSADIVNIIGEVISIPKSITTDKRGYEGFSTKDIQMGDTAIFRFDLIHEFKMLSKTERTYKNRIWYRGQEYWSCDIQKIFGVIRDGEIKMINGYVMLTDFEEPKIILSQSNSGARQSQQSEVIHIGNSKENEKPIYANQNDTVFYNPINSAKYQIKGKPFRIIQQDKIFGKAVI